MVPVMLSFGVLGTTLAINACCVPVLARSPYASTVVSDPKEPSAAAWISAGMAGSAGLLSACSEGLGAGVSPQPERKNIIAAESTNCREGVLRTEGITLPDEHRATL